MRCAFIAVQLFGNSPLNGAWWCCLVNYRLSLRQDLVKVFVLSRGTSLVERVFAFIYDKGHLNLRFAFACFGSKLLSPLPISSLTGCPEIWGKVVLASLPFYPFAAFIRYSKNDLPFDLDGWTSVSVTVFWYRHRHAQALEDQSLS